MKRRLSNESDSQTRPNKLSTLLSRAFVSREANEPRQTNDTQYNQKFENVLEYLYNLRVSDTPIEANDIPLEPNDTDNAGPVQDGDTEMTEKRKRLLPLTLIQKDVSHEISQSPTDSDTSFYHTGLSCSSSEASDTDSEASDTDSEASDTLLTYSDTSSEASFSETDSEASFSETDSEANESDTMDTTEDTTRSS